MRAKILIPAIVTAVVAIGGLSTFLYIQSRQCPKSCDDKNLCTEDFCSKETKYKCRHDSISDCCGNTKCESQEVYENCPADCPNCDDNNKCTKDSYDYHIQKCANAPITDAVCCGNSVCEIGETYANCSRDCPNCDDNNKCTKDFYDYHGQKCSNKVIIPCCGNGLCDKGAETRSICLADCPECDDKSKLTADSFNYETQKCQYITTHYFIDDFEQDAGNWEFFGDHGPNTAWGVTVVDGNTVLRGTGHNWANLQAKEWNDYIFKARFKVVKEGSGIHFNFRNTMGEKGPTRYFIGVGSNHLNLAKQINEKFFGSLSQPKNFSGLDLGDRWHTFEIRGYGDIINIFIDNELLIKYKDIEDPVFSGGIAFETLDDSEFLIDDIEIKVISKKDIIYP